MMLRRSARSLVRRSIALPSYLSSQIPSKPSKPYLPSIPTSYNLMWHPIRPNSWTLSPVGAVVGDFRRGSSAISGGGGEQPLALDYGKDLDEINLKFAEAREEIEAAMESKDTVYFDEEAECARDAVKVVLDMFNGLLARLPEKERTSVQRSMGLKMEQLKAELKQLED